MKRIRKPVGLPRFIYAPIVCAVIVTTLGVGSGMAADKNAKVTLVYEHVLPNVPGKRYEQKGFASLVQHEHLWEQDQGCSLSTAQAGRTKEDALKSHASWVVSLNRGFNKLWTP